MSKSRSSHECHASQDAAEAAAYTVGYTTNRITTADGIKYDVVRHRMAYHTNWTTLDDLVSLVIGLWPVIPVIGVLPHPPSSNVRRSNFWPLADPKAMPFRCEVLNCWQLLDW